MASGENKPFALETILLKPEGGRYVGTILTGTLSDILAWKRPVDNIGSSSAKVYGGAKGGRVGIVDTVSNVGSSGGGGPEVTGALR